MTCTCIVCSTCKGNGYIWEDMFTHELSKYRTNDHQEMYECPDCNGEGIDSYCDECLSQEDEED